ncbi:MAG TPA: DUF1080 domain-containing protein [Bryobacteraceae bacterium]|nr:DUF1080 domain-containing protein [Bryobacteraceae bacterium]
MMLKRVLVAGPFYLALAAMLFAQGRGGVLNITPEQAGAIGQMNTELVSLTQSLTSARRDLVETYLNSGNIPAKVNAVKAAELALANARAEAFGKIQNSPQKIAADQIGMIAAASGAPGGGRGGGRGANARGGSRAPAIGATAIPHSTAAQGKALYQMATDTAALVSALNEARSAVIAASLTAPATISAKVDAVAAAELNLANARSTAMAKIQGSANKLDAEQLTALVAMNGNFGAGGFSQPEPMNFQDHTGYVSLFDGASLKGWDGNPRIWRVENGAIVGESTPTNPSGNSYIVNRTVEAHDFTLKFEIKVEGSGGSGLQYRSKTGIPWRRPIPANLQPVNLNWMQTGPQADFWPSQIYTGQVYSENTPMGIEAYRGQVVEGAGMGARRLMGTIGDLAELGKLVKMNDWNEYTIIARGPMVLHIVNGQLMAAFVDDDPESSNNGSGNFGIEIEATTKVSVRNIWLKKIN